MADLNFLGTQGEWRLTGNNDGIIRAEDNEIIALASDTSTDDPMDGFDMIYNAALIAAAPELLEALKEFVRLSDKPNLMESIKAVKTAKSVIKKALNK